MSIWGCRTLHLKGSVARAALGLVVLSGGCAYGELRQVLRAQVASEADCSDIAVRKTSPYAPGYKDNQYTVKGCKVDRIYTCKGDDGMVAYGHADCTFVEGGSTQKAPAATPAASGDDLDQPLDAPSAGGDVGDSTAP